MTRPQGRQGAFRPIRRFGRLRADPASLK
jgi:hypothetical protein